MFHEYNFYCTFVWQHTKENPINNTTIQSHLPENAIIPIKFKRFDTSSFNCFSVVNVGYRGPMILVAQETITDVPVAKLLSDKSASTVLISEVLSRLELPESEKSDIAEQIFTLLESAETILPIYVKIIREACRVIEIRLQYDDDDDDDDDDNDDDDDDNDDDDDDDEEEEEEIERVTREPMDAYEVKAVPAAKEVIDGLERVQVSLVELREEAKEMPCVICMEVFEDGVEAICLPCMHVFHEKCCVEWLMTSQLCPLCRYIPFS